VLILQHLGWRLVQGKRIRREGARVPNSNRTTGLLFSQQKNKCVSGIFRWRRTVP